MMSFEGTPTSDGFVKRYELHYQPKMEVDGAILDAQFGCLNFHTKQHKSNVVKLTVAVKNKWPTGWTKGWFYCKVPVHVCPQGGKSIHALHSHMSALEFLTEPPINCPNTGTGDAAFVKATSSIGGL
jgi:hypothetical protein